MHPCLENLRQTERPGMRIKPCKKRWRARQNGWGREPLDAHTTSCASKANRTYPATAAITHARNCAQSQHRCTNTTVMGPFAMALCEESQQTNQPERRRPESLQALRKAPPPAHNTQKPGHPIVQNLHTANHCHAQDGRPQGRTSRCIAHAASARPRPDEHRAQGRSTAYARPRRPRRRQLGQLGRPRPPTKSPRRPRQFVQRLANMDARSTARKS